MVFFGGHEWFFPGGACVGYDEIRSMSGRYASYWNAFLFHLFLREWDGIFIKVKCSMAKRSLNLSLIKIV